MITRRISPEKQDKAKQTKANKIDLLLTNHIYKMNIYNEYIIHIMSIYISTILQMGMKKDMNTGIEKIMTYYNGVSGTGIHGFMS